MHIGLIGGIGPAAQDYYTRTLIALFAEAGVPLEMTTAHADTPTLIANLGADRRDAQADIFVALTERLQRAGADLVAVTSIAGAFCRVELAARSALPVVDLVGVVSRHIVERGLTRIGVLGTRRVMETRFYGGIAGVEILTPPEPMLDRIHTAYVTMAVAGAITPDPRDTFHRAADDLIAAGAEAIMLGGTDLALAFDIDHSAHPLIDCAAIHARAIADRALG